MELTNEQMSAIRQQLLNQIETSFPEEKKQENIEYINSLDDKELINFIRDNNLINSEEEFTNSSNPNQCIFCSIVFGELPSTMIGENEKAIAILELNPISSGHSLIIPKEHLINRNKLPAEAYNLANIIGEKLNNSLHPKEIKILEGEVMGHQIINIIPIYQNESLNSPRTKKTPQELLELKTKIEMGELEKIEVKEEEIPEIQTKEINDNNTWLPKRIP